MALKKRSIFTLSIRTKIYAVIGLTLVLFVSGYIIYQVLAHKQAKLNNLFQKKELQQAITAILETNGKFIEKINSDYAQYSNSTPFPQLTGQRPMLSASGPSFLNIDFVLTYSGNHRLTNSALSRKMEGKVPSIPDSLLDVVVMKKRMRFYLFSEGRLFHVAGSMVNRPAMNNPADSAFEILFTGKLYDQNFFTNIGNTLGCKLEFRQDATSPVPGMPSDSTSTIRLYSGKDTMMGNLHFEKHDVYLTTLHSLGTFIDWFFGLFFVILLIVTLVTYNTLILKPLRIIRTALDHQSEKIARKLMYHHDEFGKISRLVIRFFSQQKLLTDKIERLNDSQAELKQLNEILNTQKEELETSANNLLMANESIQYQQKLLRDNMYYASIVQKAALMPSFDVSRVFSEHFILFKPKDVVSGDFYWFKELNGKYLVAAADCTGHGLSGSLMSMLGISFLNQTVSQLNTEHYSAADILDKLRWFIVESLHQQGSKTEISDGIDIVLCIFDFEEMEIEFAAAYCPLYLIRYHEDKNAYEIKTFKGDSMPVGIHEKKDRFTNHILPIRQGDQIYMFTDGFVDQFGGPNDKKFLARNLQHTLLENAAKTMAEQKQILDTTFENWKGITFQVDDVTMLGMRV